MWPNPQETEDLVTFPEEIVNRKLHYRYFYIRMTISQNTLGQLFCCFWCLSILFQWFHVAAINWSHLCHKIFLRRCLLTILQTTSVFPVTLYGEINLAVNFQTSGGISVNKYTFQVKKQVFARWVCLPISGQCC